MKFFESFFKLNIDNLSIRSEKMTVALLGKVDNSTHIDKLDLHLHFQIPDKETAVAIAKELRFVAIGESETELSEKPEPDQ